jgi:hypothetical protein
MAHPHAQTMSYWTEDKYIIMSTPHLHVDFFPQLTLALFVLKRLECLELFKSTGTQCWFQSASRCRLLHSSAAASSENKILGKSSARVHIKMRLCEMHIYSTFFSALRWDACQGVHIVVAVRASK